MSGSPKIRLKSVRKTFAAPRSGAETLAVDDVSLDILAGEFLCIVGPSGCGKSTLLNIIAGLDMPTSGVVEMDSRPITGPGAERGVVFQDYALFPWNTVEENIGFGLRHRAGPRPSADERRLKVADYIDLVALSGAEHKFPHQLSGGMRQRCALARSLANEPEVLLMDEPLAALDAQTRLILQEELLRIWGQERQARERQTVVFVTHGIDEAVFLGDRVAVMSSHPGRMKEVIVVDLPRPRQETMRASPEFQALTAQIWNHIRDEAYRATVATRER
jgi:NitT/TauT family transport system ATP-binding protein